jgi:CBS-domain-containing membrane protein
MRVKDIMTLNVICVGADEAMVNAARLMLQHQISGLPVVDKEGELIGIVTEGDFLRRTNLVRNGAEMARIRPWARQARPGIRARVRQKN